MKNEYDFSGAKRGPVVPQESGKTRITIRIDSDVIDWFREQVNQAGGGSYQALMNEALRRYISEQKTEQLPDTVKESIRQIVREEMAAALAS
jgi:uncharacterized protein (DUF4415 family)